jgi:hypothetical protein
MKMDSRMIARLSVISPMIYPTIALATPIKNNTIAKISFAGISSTFFPFYNSSYNKRHNADKTQQQNCINANHTKKLINTVQFLERSQKSFVN